MPAVNDVGEPCAREPHARFDGRELETERHGQGHRSGTTRRETAGTKASGPTATPTATAPAPDPTHVIDAKKYTGRPHLRVDGGFLRPRTEMLTVGTRNCTKLLDGVHRQVQLVAGALASCPQAKDSPAVRGMLCFVDADWPLIGGSFRIAQIDVLWPGKAAEKLTSPGALTPADIDLIHHDLAAAFPRA